MTALTSNNSPDLGAIAHDTGEHGLSQRYFTSGLHASHTAGDRSVGVYLLACMST
jgi:hypothetical protein